MRLTHLIVGCALCMPVATLAQQASPMPPSAPPTYLQGLVSEEDVTALFDYLRGALIAASEGRDVPPMPEELKSRMNMLGAELKLRGTIGGLLLLKSIEAQLKELMRERPPASPALPPATPYERSSAMRS